MRHATCQILKVIILFTFLPHLILGKRYVFLGKRLPHIPHRFVCRPDVCYEGHGDLPLGEQSHSRILSWHSTCARVLACPGRFLGTESKTAVTVRVTEEGTLTREHCRPPISSHTDKVFYRTSSSSSLQNFNSRHSTTPARRAPPSRWP